MNTPSSCEVEGGIYREQHLAKMEQEDGSVNSADVIVGDTNSGHLDKGDVKKGSQYVPLFCEQKPPTSEHLVQYCQEQEHEDVNEYKTLGEAAASPCDLPSCNASNLCQGDKLFDVGMVDDYERKGEPNPAHEAQTCKHSAEICKSEKELSRWQEGFATPAENMCSICDCDRLVINGTAVNNGSSALSTTPNRHDLWQVECPVCHICHQNQEELVVHCRNVHNDEMCVVEKLEFKTSDEFEDWKKGVESKTDTCWKIRDRNTCPSHILHVNYECINADRNRPRVYVNLLDSNNSIRYCTSFMQQCIKCDGCISVKYCTRHISHEYISAVDTMSKKDFNVIEKFLRLGFTPKAILLAIRCTFPDPKSRLYWVTNEEIAAVKADLLLRGVHLPKRRIRKPPNWIKDIVFSPSQERVTPTSMDIKFQKRKHGNMSCPTPISVKNGINDVARSRKLEQTTFGAGEPIYDCASCTKLSKKVAELRATVDWLEKRLLKYVESPFSSNMDENE